MASLVQKAQKEKLKNQIKKELDKELEYRRSKENQELIKMMTKLVALCLYDLHGFGHKRQQRVLDKLTGYGRELLNGSLDMEAIDEFLEKHKIDIA